jgi:hypothetical protein
LGEPDEQPIGCFSHLTVDPESLQTDAACGAIFGWSPVLTASQRGADFQG